MRRLAPLATLVVALPLAAPPSYADRPTAARATAPTDDESCEVSIVRAPKRVRDAITARLGLETSCAPLEVRAVPTRGGYYVVARAPNGRLFEDVVARAALAGELVWKWARPTSPATPPSRTARDPADDTVVIRDDDAGDDDAGHGYTRARDTATRDTAMRDTAMRDGDVRDAGVRDTAMRDAAMRDGDVRDADMRDGDVRDADVRDPGVRDADLRVSRRRSSRGVALGGIIGGGMAGVRGAIDVWGRGRFSVGIAVQRSAHERGWQLAPGNAAQLVYRDFRAVVLGSFTVGDRAWRLGVHAGGGLVHSDARGAVVAQHGHQFDGALDGGGVFGVVEAGFSVSRTLGARWSISVGPLVTVYAQRYRFQDPSNAMLEVHRDLDVAALATLRRDL